MSEADCVIRGHVTLQGGSPAGLVVRVTARSSTGTRGWDQWGAQVDAKGDFVIENMAPGSYEVQATTFALSQSGTRQAASATQTVSISRGAPGQVSLSLDLGAK